MFSLLTLLDDIATTFDDVAVMTKIAIEKTSVLMSDDLAVNADVVTGARPDRELPIVKAIFWGSLLNKVIAITGVLIILAIYPPILKGILLLGGLYLCFEGGHKVFEKIFHKNQAQDSKKAITEKQRIKGAIRTDLVLSIEIMVIAKQSIYGNLLNQGLSLALVGLGASVIIYGLVAILVKIDDFGIFLIKKEYKKFGMALVKSMPYTMKGLGIVGTIAMFLVGGGIIGHTFHIPHYAPEMLQNLILGLIGGILIVVPFEFIKSKV